MILTHGMNSLSSAIPLPQHCILLDYFLDGYRVGVQPTGGSFTSVSQESVSFLDYSSIFPNGMPIALFDGTDASITTNYDIADLVDISSGYTIEFWMKVSTNSSSWFLSTCRTHYDGSSDWNTLFRNTYTGYNWKTSTGSMSYNMTSQSQNVTNWHHFAMQRESDYMRFYTNGSPSTQLAYHYPSNPNELLFSLLQYAGDVNSSMVKRANYSIAQLAIWDYPKYPAGYFTPSNKLIIDPSYS